MCTASALISIGSVLGKTNPVQLTVIALLEVTGFVFNQWLLRSLLRVRRRPASHRVFSNSDGNNLKVLSVDSGAAPEQHHAASCLWSLFRTHAHLDTELEGIRAAVREGEISLQTRTFFNVGYE